MMNIKFGWKPDLPDHRDHYYSLRGPSTLPSLVDLRSTCPTAFNQFDLGSCVANSIACVMKFNQTLQKKRTIFTPSRLFIYWHARLLEGTINEDAGATIRDGIKAVARWGAPPETVWPYDVSKFKLQPSSSASVSGLSNQAISYQRINQDIVSMQTCLASGFPFVLGFSVYESFMSSTVARTGLATMPSGKEKNIGGHAVTAIGYNAGKTTANGIPPKHFLIHNSWGPNWGVKGRFFMPFEYLLNNDLADDFWTIRQVE